MAIEHAAPGEVIDLNTFGPDDNDTHTVALVKTKHLEAMRIFVRGGAVVPEHYVDGPITVQCLRGELKFFVDGDPQPMQAGTWLHLEGGTPHSIDAISDCVVLVTILFTENGA